MGYVCLHMTCSGWSAWHGACVEVRGQFRSRTSPSISMWPLEVKFRLAVWESRATLLTHDNFSFPPIACVSLCCRYTWSMKHMRKSEDTLRRGSILLETARRPSGLRGQALSPAEPSHWGLGGRCAGWVMQTEKRAPMERKRSSEGSVYTGDRREG